MVTIRPRQQVGDGAMNRLNTDSADAVIRSDWRRTMVCLGVVWTCLLGPRTVWAAQASSCVGSPPIEQAIYFADLVYVGTVTSALPDGRVQFRLVEAIKGQVDSTPVLHESGARFVAGHTYIVLAIARVTANDSPPSYRLPRGCGLAASEVVADDRRLVDRAREIAREQSRTAERPRVGVFPPKRVKKVAPAWPSQAQVSQAQDSATVTVVLEVTINAAGVVSDARVLRSVPSFDHAAIEAARRWEYLPALINGVAVPVITTEVVVFTRP